MSDKKVDRLHDYKLTMCEDGSAIINGTVEEVRFARKPMNADAAFYEWVMDTVESDPKGVPLCAGARVVVDEHGEGTLTVDSSLPQGQWIVEEPEKTYILTGVTGPNVKYVTLDERETDAEDTETRPRDDEGA